MASRQFRHRSQYPDDYDILQQCPTTGTEVCKASFREHQVRKYLELNPSANEFKVNVEMLSGRNYFVLQARIGGQDQNIFLFADLPCPDRCIPPGKDLVNPVLNRDDIQEVIDTTHCLWMQVHRSTTISMASSGENVSNLYQKITIYALTDDGQGGLVNQWDLEDKMYITN